MVDVVNRNTIEEDEVLVGPAAPYIKATCAFGAALHTRHQLKGFDEVGLSQKHGDLCGFLRIQLYAAHLRAAQIGDGSLTLNNYFVEGNDRLQSDVDNRVLAQI